MTCIRPRRGPRHRPGALLLETLIALTIMIAAMGLLAGQLVSGLRMVREAEEQTRAGELADRMLTMLELDLPTMEQFLLDEKTDGDFGEQYPGWHWRALVQETDIPGLGSLTIQILRQSDPEHLDELEGARVVRSVHVLKAEPGTIDLERDFGLTKSQTEMLSLVLQQMGFGPNIDPHQLAAMEPEMMFQMVPLMLPLFAQMSGGGLPGGLGGLLGDGGLGDLLGGGQIPPELLDMLGGGQIPPELFNMLGSGALSPDLINQFLGGAGGGLPPGLLEQLGGLGGGAGPISPGGISGSGVSPEIQQMIRSALGGQVSDAELDQLFNSAGSGGAPARGPGAGGGGGQRGAGAGQRGDGPLNIRDLDTLRDQRNARRPTRAGGRGG